MGEQEIETDPQGPPKGYQADALTIQLGLLVEGGKEPKSKSAVEDHSDADALRKRLKAAEMKLTAEVSRLNGVIAQNRDRFERIGADHLDKLDEVKTDLDQAGSHALEPVSRLDGQVNYLHAEYMRRAAKDLPSAITYRDQIGEQSTPIQEATTKGEALLTQVGTALTQVLAGAEQAWQTYQAEQKQAQAEWKTQSATLKAALDRLEDQGSDISTDLLSELAGNAKAAEKDYVVALTEVRALADRCERARESHEFAIEETRKIRLQQFDAIKEGMTLPSWVDELQDKLGELTGTLDVRKLFTRPLEQAEKILKNANNPKAFRAALALANEAKAVFDDYSRSETEIEQMSWDRAAIKRVLDFYKSDRPKDHKAMQVRFDALEKGWTKMKPSEAAKGYATLNKEAGADSQSSWVWDNFTGRCNIEQKWRDAFKLKAGEIKDNLDKLDTRIRKSQAEDGAEGYQGQAQAEYRGLVASGDIEVADYAVAEALSKRLADLGGKVKAYLAVPTSDLTKDAAQLSGVAAQLVLDQAGGMQRRKAYLDRYDYLKAVHQEAIEAHKALADQSYSESDAREYEDIRTLINKAAKIATATKDESDLQDVEAAISMSESSKVRLLALGRAGESVDRGKLALIQRDWANGLATFRGDLDGLVKAVKGLTDKEPQPKKPDDGGEPTVSYYGADAGVLAAADVVFDYFAKFDFTNESRDLALDGDENRETRKRARETALAKVRDAMGFLMGNPASRLLMTNQFGETAVGRGFYRSMRRIELEVLRGV